MKEEIQYRTCHLCEPMCGLQIKIRGNEIVSIKGHDDDVYSKGHIYPKGVALKDLHDLRFCKLSCNTAFNGQPVAVRKIRR